MSTELQDFLHLSYSELEELNLHAKEQRTKRVPMGKIQEERLKYLTDEKRIKAVTLLFSDLEGRLHMLDYDKKFLVKSWDNMTFDGSSIRGFTAQRESDLRLGIDWSAFYWAPCGHFRRGQGNGLRRSDRQGRRPYPADMRAMLKAYAQRAVRNRRPHAKRRQRDRRIRLPGRRRREALCRNQQVRVRQHGRLLSFAAGRHAAAVHRQERRSAARHGIPEREGSSRSGAVAVRDQLWLRGSGGRGRPDPDLQADLPPGGHQDGPDRQLSCRSPWWASTAAACTPTSPS